jgi:hypothetical protein
MLAAVFNIPSAQGAGQANLAGLQTRACVNNLIQERVAQEYPMKNQLPKNPFMDCLIY